MLCGVFFAPQSYKASNSYSSGSYLLKYGNFGICAYSSDSEARLNGLTDSSISVPMNYLKFRIWVILPYSLPEGSEVGLSAKIKHSVGSIKSVQAFFCNTDGLTCFADNIHTERVFFDYNGMNTSYARDKFKLASLCTAIAFDITFSSRTSTDLYLSLDDITLELQVPSVIESELIDINNNSGSILDNIKSVLVYIANLPTNIGNYLKSSFTNVVTAVTNLPSNLSVFFSNVVTSVTNLPSNLSGFFSNVVTAVSNLPTNISGFFFDIGDKIDSFMSLFDSPSGGGGGHSIDGTPLEQATAELNDLRDALRTDNVSDVFDYLGQYVPNSEHFLVRVYTMIFENQLVHNIVYLSLIFGVMSYLLFGKR